MKILMLHPHDIYADLEPWTVRITYIAQEFVKRGHEVKLIYHLLDTNKSPEEMRNRQEYPFEVIPLIRYSRTLFNKIKIVTDIAKWADVVHFQKCFFYVSIPAIFAAYRNKIPVHYEWDDWEYLIYNYRPLNKKIGRSIDIAERVIPKLVDTVSVSSDELRNLCLKLGVREDRIFEAHVGGDLGRFHPGNDGSRIKEMHDIRSPIVLYLGQLHGAQYAELFINAAKEILTLRDDVTFLIVGTGDRFGELHALAEQLQISSKIIFTGAVDHKLVPEYIAAADVTVACFEDNQQTRSKSPLKVVEYLASGKAIVATDMGEVKKMVGGCGILVPPGDIYALAEGINKYLDDPDLRSDMGKKARQRAEEKYNWGVTASNLLDAYRLGMESFNFIKDKKKTIRKDQKDSNDVDIIDSSKLPEFVKNNLDLVGIIDGEYAYTGPKMVQLDVTNRCNNDCIGCWCRSPLLLDKRMPMEVQKQTLPFELVVSVIDDIYNMGTREIYLAGGGEPFMHPQIIEIIEHIKNKGMTCFINTNFTLLNEERIAKLADLKVDHFTISLWAGTPEIYSRLHPNKTEETFLQVKEMLKKLIELKQGPPYIKLYNVISKLNYFELDKMVEFALEIGAESVEFTVIDVIPGYTDTLLLSEEERTQLLGSAEKIHNNLNGFRKKGLELFQFEQFYRRISTPYMTTGNYDKEIIDSMPCCIGWAFSRILPDGNVNACLKAHRIPVGNVYEKPFHEIWNSTEQRMFRKKTNVYKKKDPFFSLIGNDPDAEVGCYKSCDDLSRNQHIHFRMQQLTQTQQKELKKYQEALRASKKYIQ